MLVAATKLTSWYSSNLAEFHLYLAKDGLRWTHE